MNTAARTAASPHKAGAPEAARPLDTGAVTKRLQQELMSLMASGGDGVSAFPAGDSLFDWVGTINVRVACLPVPMPASLWWFLCSSRLFWRQARTRVASLPPSSTPSTGGAPQKGVIHHVLTSCVTVLGVAAGC